MKKLQSISIVLPMEDNQGNELKYSEFLALSAQIFGGFTTSKQVGGWYSTIENRIMQDESIKLELCFDTNDYTIEHKLIIESILEYLFDSENGGQEAVFASINNESYILENTDILEFSETVNSLQYNY